MPVTRFVYKSVPMGAGNTPEEEDRALDFLLHEHIPHFSAYSELYRLEYPYLKTASGMIMETIRRFYERHWFYPTWVVLAPVRFDEIGPEFVYLTSDGDGTERQVHIGVLPFMTIPGNSVLCRLHYSPYRVI